MMNEEKTFVHMCRDYNLNVYAAMQRKPPLVHQSIIIIITNRLSSSSHHLATASISLLSLPVCLYAVLRVGHVHLHGVFEDMRVLHDVGELAACCRGSRAMAASICEFSVGLELVDDCVDAWGHI